MKKRIILSAIIIILGVAGILGYSYYRSFHKVALTLSSEMKGAVIYSENGKEIQKMASSGDISVQNGNYYIIPEGEKVSKQKIPFTVKDNEQTLKLDPDYSIDYLDVALVNEQAAITTALTSAFPLVDTYNTTNGKLYHHGEWYGAVVTPTVDDPREEPDTYKVVLHKQDGEWKVVNSPVLVLTKTDFKEVPVSILKAINRLDQ